MRIVKKWGQFYFSFTGVKNLKEKGMRIHGRSVKELLINMKHKNLKFLEAAPSSENLLYHIFGVFKCLWISNHPSLHDRIKRDKVSTCTPLKVLAQEMHPEANFATADSADFIELRHGVGRSAKFF